MIHISNEITFYIDIDAFNRRGFRNNGLPFEINIFKSRKTETLKYRTYHFFQPNIQWNWNQILADGIGNSWFSINNPENPPYDWNRKANYRDFCWPRGQHCYNETNDFRQPQYW